MLPVCDKEDVKLLYIFNISCKFLLNSQYLLQIVKEADTYNLEDSDDGADLCLDTDHSSEDQPSTKAGSSAQSHPVVTQDSQRLFPELCFILFI